MPAPSTTIKIQAGHKLMERIQAVSGYLDVTPANFIEYALEAELSRQESHARLEHAALEELRGSVLAVGQSVSIHDDAEHAEHDICQLCLRVMVPRGQGVEGPLLCEECYQIAKGDRAPRVADHS
jgi:hypothetical protein